MPGKGDGCGGGLRWDYEHQRPMIKGMPAATISESDLPVRGKMSESDLLDMRIDLHMLSADEFINKHC